MKQINRRTFLKGSLAAGVAPMFIPARLLGDQAPSKMLNLACIGIGNQGSGISRSLGGHERTRVVAVCDVDLDHGRVNAVLEQFPDASRYHDFREMLDKMGDEIDAVSICTPDHSHFPIAMLAMSMGKHVFVEKPLANTFQETELMMQAAKKYGVVTQMNNQGHSGANYFQAKAYAEAGLFDGVNKVVSCFNRWRRWHPWDDVQGYPSGEQVPEGLKWDLWHTTAEERPFSERYHPGNWRGWHRYGLGALGDWGPHILDTAHRFLHLGLPTQVELVHIKRHNPYIFPLETTLKFTFPTRGDQPEVEVYWYEGTENRPEDEHIGDAGRVLYGGAYTFAGGSHASAIRVVPEEMRQKVQSALPRFGGGSNHNNNFILSALGIESPRSPFEVAGPLTQVLNLGVIAQELGQVGVPLRFDPATKKFVNHDEANKLLSYPSPRKGWEHLYAL